MKKKLIMYFILTAIFFVFPLDVKGLNYCKYRRLSDPIALIFDENYVVFSDNGDNTVRQTKKNLFVEADISYSSYVSDNFTLNDIKNLNCPQYLCVDGSKYYSSSSIDAIFNSSFKTRTCYSLNKAGAETLSSVINDMTFVSEGSSNVSFPSVIISGNCFSDVPIAKLLKICYDLLKIVAPLGLVIFGMIDMAKAMTSSDENKMKKAQGALVRRLIAAVIVFLSFVIVGFIVNLLPATDSLECVKDFF